MAVIIALIIWAVCAGADIAYTRSGLDKGVAVEGNRVVVWFFGNKPKTWQLIIYDVVEAFWLCTPYLVAPDNPACVGITFGMLCGLAVRHVEGARAWRKLGA